MRSPLAPQLTPLLTPLLMLLMLLMLLISGSAASATTTLAWQAQSAPGHVSVVELWRPDPLSRDGSEQRLMRFLSKDAGRSGRYGWCADTDPMLDQITAQIDLSLPPGVYLLRQVDTTGSHRSALFVTAADAAAGAPMTVDVSLPAKASGVIAWRRSASGHDGFAWAPATGSTTGDSAQHGTLRLTTGSWRLSPMGVGGWASEDLSVTASSRQLSLSFRPRSPPTPRVLAPSQAWIVRVLLAPVTLLIGGSALFGAWRARRLAGLPAAIALSAVVATLALRSVLPSPGAVLLDAGPPIEDPPDSVGLLHTITASLPTLSDHAATYSAPEGASWLHAGPSWLGYLTAAPLSALLGPIAGHNLGVMLGCALLCLAAWAYSRSLGCSPAAAALAGVATALGPTALDELDAMSLDRSTLYLVPIALLCLHQAARRPGWRWPVAAGLALAAVFYGQVYFGLYLAAAAPWLVLPRLLGPTPARRLLRLSGVGAVALAVLLPGLVALQLGTAGTHYHDDPAQLRAAVDDAVGAPGKPAVDPQTIPEIAAYLTRVDPTLRSQAMGQPQRGSASREAADELPMDTPRQRQLTATALGLSLPELLRPAELLPGRALYWPLALLALIVVGRRRRPIVALALLDVLILMVHGMGPLLRPTPTTVGPPLPFALDLALIPGFDQLKNSHRFGLLAASIAAVPLALGFDSLIQLAPARARRLLAWPLAIGTGVLLAGLRVPATEVQLTPKPPGAASVGMDLRWPQARAVHPVPGWDGLEGTVLALPLVHPTPRDLVLAAALQHLSLANPPSFDEADQALPLWVEENALLNRLSWASGGDRAGQWLELDEATGAQDLQTLRDAGLRAISLHDDLLAGPELVEETTALLDQWLERAPGKDPAAPHSADSTGGVTVWLLPKASE